MVSDVSHSFPHSHWSLTGIFLILFAGVLVIAQSLLIPIVLAILVTLVLNPMRRGLNRIGLPSGIAAAIIVTALLSLLLVIGSGVYAALSEHSGEIETLIPDALQRLEQLTGIIQPVVDASEKLDQFALQDEAEEVVVQTSSLFSLLAQSTPIVLGMIALTVTLTFFLLASGDMFYEKLVGAMPNLRDKARALAITRSIEKHLSCYLLTITFINAGLGLSIGVVMWLLGMPSPILFGVAAFLLNYIPYVGALSGVALAFFVALLSFDTLLAAFVPALAYLALTSFEGQFLTPFLVGRRLQLNAVVVFLSLAVWAWLWSIPGMFLSTPILISLKAFSARIPQLSGLSRFMAERRDISGRDGIILKRFIPYEEDYVATQTQG